MTFSVRRTIPATHPSLHGHFPGNPVVPGVIVLEEVLLSLASWMPDRRVEGFQYVKFVRPVRPGQSFRIELERSGRSKIAFSFGTRERALGSGTIILQPLKGGG